ncbi:MAG: D-sedoheptulose-7-phosphate isomerase [Candidatus Humimicrobiaceae bacterium]
MKQTVEILLDRLIKENPILEFCNESIKKSFEIVAQCYLQGGKLLICGNGGSAADSEHIVGELMKGFLKKRNICSKDIERLRLIFPDEWKYLSDNLQGALPALSLSSHSALLSAFINDISPEMVFAQQVYGYGKKGDVLIGISTSGKSKNIVNALKIAKAFEIKTIGLTGKSGGFIKDLCDILITVPSDETYKIQEYHLPIYHTLCAMVEETFF